MSKKEEAVAVKEVEVELERAPLLTTEKADKAVRVQLAKKAELLLGYSPLRDDIYVAGTLGEVLRGLEIEPYTKSSVEAYKSSKARTIRKRVNYQQVITTRRWVQKPISEYTKPIPEFVLNKAVQIKEKAPGVSLFVDELIATTRKRAIPQPDPFLVAKLGQEEYYIDVWDEPKFEGRIRRK